MAKLHGIIPPLVTPLTADERIDAAGLERQLQRMLAGGVHGIFFLGSTGEAPALHADEKQRAIEIARGAIGDAVPLVVGCMASGTSKAIENIHQAVAGGADYVAVTPPHYYPSAGPAEQLAHYRACVAASDVPLVIYNIPSTTKVMLSPETTAAIADLGGVAGLKDSSTDFSHFLRLLDRLGGRADFSVLIGSPILAGAALLCGGDGAVPGIANLDPRLMADIYETARTGDLECLKSMQSRLLSLFRVTSFGAPIACLKAALELMGVCQGHCTAPLQPPSVAARDEIAAVLRQHGLL